MLKIILAIVLFSVIVIFHELGHFLFAKKNGICVEEFAIGIGPTIFGKQIGETKYSIKCLPFGGCCVMLGEERLAVSLHWLVFLLYLQAHFSILFWHLCLPYLLLGLAGQIRQ